MGGILVWAALPRGARLRKPLGNGEQPYLTPHQTIRFRNPAEMRGVRLHGWESALDVVLDTNGPMICRAEVSGAIERDERDATHAAAFTPLWMGDAVPLMERFVLQLAGRALQSERDAGRHPVTAILEVVEYKRRSLNGEHTEQQLRAAWNNVIAGWRYGEVPGKLGPLSQEAAWLIRGATWPFVGYSKYTWDAFKVVLRFAMADGQLPRPGFPIAREELDATLSEMFTQAFGEQPA